MSKGSRTERELVGLLEDAGLSAMRVAASGAGTTDDRPDVVAWADHLVLVIEAKSRKEPYVRFRKEEIEAVERMTEHAGAIGMTALRPNRLPWKVFHPSDLQETPKAFSITREMYAEGLTLAEWLDVVLPVDPLDVAGEPTEEEPLSLGRFER